ncbi:hypothetical protein [Sphingomonas xinjiangensis]|uniref:DUF2946 domain-containing protein n=1 Tax=Sphingomonas xinjiangensis TaxID=643568 RepID=A0A840YG97_9SPHN|nr:hypothetical protein [Sphingomonas xinjiangensis]MBB5709808.1 hypothetical protein [Sphingomonas xinjiangensis]
MLSALALRLAVPAGFMPVLGDHGLRLVACSGSGPMLPIAPPAHTSMPGMHGSAGHAHHASAAAPVAMQHGDAPAEHPQAEDGCAFADLATPALAGADPIQLASAILFIVAAALFFRAALAVGAAPRLRPPLRGPPLPA